VGAFLRLLTNWPEIVSLFLLLGYCLASVWRHGSNPRIDRQMAAVALVLPGIGMAYALNCAVNALRPYKLDPYIFRLDGLLGCEPSFLAGQVVKALPHAAQVALAMAYSLMPIEMVLLYWVYAWRFPGECRTLARVLIANLALAAPLYFLVPVAGPFYAFPGFPNLPPPLIPHPLRLHALPNGVPSVHFSTALLCAWYARRLAWGRWIGLLYVLATAAATMGFGEHYFFDLVAAVPYAAAIVRLEARLPSSPSRALGTGKPILKWREKAANLRGRLVTKLG
jgi:hypothetical protein